jgi:RimJ/RimL family protein N-acetyltransferase
MSEALRAVLSYGFEIEGVQLVSAEVMLGNVASKKLLEKQYGSVKAKSCRNDTKRRRFNSLPSTEVLRFLRAKL